ncbi:methyl-accepting chemotaxis protein [Neorhizobium galegae]|uniref:methyl-accepting chemotaxis protein n=1 Tax=Neorhizobium galegae TaxID=399 RepID=UPI000622336E|nr:methyl-accepting chemotaxis protein [Neorhizobium galegae]CDZ28399.1 Methyl-accepting chemotaxis protein [Neorhizobium galegae bv. officinalis]KAA9388171.1 methyl-accepting chemotaxis protein [Neorhizobium galegae]KAB1115369.1 methyl-accepting chemotaxis protein [Neorhizobium galegae]MCM2498445.1 methyl-accepting chemotaxis protein [Neorhizobium galegae]MCQ1773358.1 methyl-accepting chemotaxis protein [Neorhizobium galegae]
MIGRHHSLSVKVIGLVLAQNGILAGLLFYVADEQTPFEMLGIAVSLIVLTLVTVTLAGALINPLRTVAGTASQIAAGHAAVPAEHLTRTDEIGSISRSLERLCHDHLTRLIEDEEDREQREAVAEQAHARDIEAARDEARDLKTVVEALDGGLRRLAVGDLTVRLDMPFPEEYEGLRADFNHALTTLEEVLGVIGSGVHGLHSTCATIRDGMAETAEAGGRLTAALAKTAADVGALAEMLKARKMEAQHTADIAHNARLDMRPSKEMMQAATAAMEAIRKASLKIEPATATIRDLAFQANMLALNAGMEAAHSGEAENHFKTVAEEIRALAERAAEAAKEISGLSRRSAEAAEVGGRSVAKAGGELVAMTIYADALQGRVDAIAANSRKEIEAVAAVRTTMTTLAKASRDQIGALDALTATLGRMNRDIGTIGHHAGRFTPVTILHAGGVAVPGSLKPAKPGSHLRLVKS